MDEKMAKQWRKILRKAFDRGHEKTLKRIAKILETKDGK